MSCSFETHDSPCGSHGDTSQIIPLAKCTEDMTTHLISLGVSSKRGRRNVSTLDEWKLILNRAGMFGEVDVSSKTICPKHRRILTIDWPGRKSNICSYPSHGSKRKQMKSPRRTNKAMSEEIFQRFQVTVPIGSAICSSCRTAHYKQRHEPEVADVIEQALEMPSTSGIQVEANKESSSSPSSQSIPCHETETISSQSSQSSSLSEKEISIWLDEKEEQNSKRKVLNDSLSSITDGRVSPLLSTLNTGWSDISTTQQKYYVKKAKEAFSATLSVISPGQEEELWQSLRQETHLQDGVESSKRRYFDSKSELIESLIKAHNEAESWQTKRQILSIFANDFTRSELQDLLPGLSKWRIDQARQHATESGKGQPIQDKPIYRDRIDNVKVDHFLDYISRPELLQDVAFGTKTLKLDSGEKVVIPAVVRTLIPSRIVEQYVRYCKQENFETASERSLYRILDVCSASMQKSLQGLDNVTADGTDAIDSLINIVKTLVESGVNTDWGTKTEQKIKEVKRYFKTDFKAHISRYEHCADHCMTYSLSDSKNKSFHYTCQHIHDVFCDRCESLKHVLKDIKEKLLDANIDDENRNRVNFDFNQCETAISAWKAHLVRSVLQEEAKQDILRDLDDESCLVIVDWAMKFLPLKYRENMCEFFGKRGRSWHVSAVITRNDGRLEVECFVHIFNACTQNNYAVASIYEHLFQTIKLEYPLITKAFLRSDNAGCYHNGPDIGKRTGLAPVRYDFSDPQAGKDICDRKTAPMKAHIRRFVNEKNNVETAEEMKTALESHGGLRGCRVAVVEVDSSKELNEGNKIPEISLLYNFQYENNGVRVWKAYNVGSGKLLTNSTLGIQPQELPGLKVIMSFGPRQREQGVIRESTSSSSEIFSCCESTCVLTFKTQREAERHMDSGKHVKELESVSNYDKIRLKWADRVTGISSLLPERVASTSEEVSSQFITATEICEMGWALKATSKRPRLGENVKRYLIEKFNAGERSGSKSDPLSVSREMKVKRDENGKLLFKPDEWKSAKTIKSFFSRYRAKLKAQQLDIAHDVEEIPEEDAEALESEIGLQDIRLAVHSELEKPEHPIEVNGKNLCELFHKKALGTLKLDELKTICTTMGLTAQGHKNRKISYISPIQELIVKCSCGI